jgi:hypothetical protein
MTMILLDLVHVSSGSVYISRPQSNSGVPGYFMSKTSYSNHYIRPDESFPTMYRSRGCRQGLDASRTGIGQTSDLPRLAPTGLIAHKWGLLLPTYAHSLGHIGGNVMSPSPIDGVGG